MTPDAFRQWLAAMKAAGLARNERDCADALGITERTLSRIKVAGSDKRTALACNALIHRIGEYDPTV
jgi:DNA-binding Xre family transcriptional regulator